MSEQECEFKELERLLRIISVKKLVFEYAVHSDAILTLQLNLTYKLFKITIGFGNCEIIKVRIKPAQWIPLKRI